MDTLSLGVLYCRDANQRVHALERQCAKLQQQLAQCTTTMEARQHRHDQIQHQQREAHAKTRAALTSVQNECTTLRAQTAHLQQHVGAADGAVVDLRKRVACLDQEKTDLTTELNHVPCSF